VHAGRKWLAATDNFTMLLNRAANVSEICRRASTSMIVATVIGMLLVAVVVASLFLGPTLRAAVLVLLTLAVVVVAVTLIRRRCVHQRAGADHQHSQPCDQTIRDFHVARS
jgi:Flp pilus assembly protein TadB